MVVRTRPSGPSIFTHNSTMGCRGIPPMLRVLRCSRGYRSNMLGVQRPYPRMCSQPCHEPAGEHRRKCKSHPAPSDPFETRCNIDAHHQRDAIVCDDNITEVNADAKFDPLVLRHIGILFCHAALDAVGTSHGVDHAGELNESAIPGVLDDTSVMLSDFGIRKASFESFQLRQRAFFGGSELVVPVP